MSLNLNETTEAMIERGAQRLLEGRLVAFPTETVYGLGADAENPEAIARIYAAKGRPANHPVIVHLAPEASLDYWADRVPNEARLLVEAFWPGPLTLIVPRAHRIPSEVAGGQSSIGLRCPSHPVAQALLRRFAQLKGGHGGVAAPSANKFGQVSPTQAEHVRAEFSDFSEQELLVLEGGASEVGIESTILDLSRMDQGVGPAILRPGHITATQIGEVLQAMPADFQVGALHVSAPRVSGTLKAHYAPRTPLRVLPRDVLLARLQETPRHGGRYAFVVLGELEAASPEGVDVIVASHDATAYARDLYALLRRLDRVGYECLVFEQPPHSAAWKAVNDRLGRAAAAFEG